MSEPRDHDTKQRKQIEEIHRILLDKSPDPIFAFSVEEKYLYVNLAFAEGVGKPAEQIIGKTIWDVFDYDEAAQRVAALRQVIQSGEEKVIEVRVPNIEHDRYYLTTITPIFDANKTVSSVICSSKDITERKQIETALQESEANYRLLLDHTYDLIWNLDAEGIITYLSPSWERITGYDAAEMVGNSFHAIIHPDDLNACFTHLENCRASKVSSDTPEYRVLHADRSWHWHKASITPALDANGEVVSIVGVSRDINDSKQAEWFREEAYRQQKMVFELLPDATFVIDNNGRVVFWNKAIEEMTGISKAEMIGRGDYEYSIPFFGKRQPILIDHALHFGKANDTSDSSYDFIRRDGDTILGEIAVPAIYGGRGAYLLGSASVLRNAAGEVMGAIESIRDISERKLLEKNLEESEEKYRLLVTRMKQGLAVHEIILDEETGQAVDYRFLDVNASFEEMTGLKREAVLGKTVLEIMPDTEPFLIENYGQVALTGETLQYQEYNKALDRHFEIIAYSHRYLQFALIYTDITQRKQMEKQIFDEKERFKTTLLSVGDGVISTDERGRVVLINPIAEALTGWRQTEALGRPLEEIFHIIHEYSRERCENPVQRVFDTGMIVELDNHTILICGDGIERPIEDTAAPILDEAGRIQGAVLVFRDCTEKVEKQKEIAFLSFHDQLTGLYNRRFFEEELIRLDHERNLPITLVMADVNGLKLTNDAFGHLRGDKLLVRAAEVMKKELRANDLIARIGGDEFMILLPKTDEEQAAMIVKRINHNLVRSSFDSVILSVSFGWASKYRTSEEMTDIYKKAEDNMYRRKLSESSSMRSKTIRVITKTLYEKNEREQEHSVRVSGICETLGRALGLSSEDILELRTVGLMHDIGKIAIDDRILDKNGSLNEAEWLEIKRHAETGYRILSSVNEYALLAEYVLAHHERWDGQGYPKGLKGKAIPLAARIIAIADAYDAITSDRPYRKAMSKEHALNEIRRNSGKQFDPDIVNAFIRIYS